MPNFFARGKGRITEENKNTINLRTAEITLGDVGDMPLQLSTYKKPCSFYVTEIGELQLIQQNEKDGKWHKIEGVVLPDWLKQEYFEQNPEVVKQAKYSAINKDVMLQTLQKNVGDPEKFKELAEEYKDKLCMHNPDKGDNTRNQLANFFRGTEEGTTSSWRKVLRMAKDNNIELSEESAAYKKP